MATTRRPMGRGCPREPSGDVTGSVGWEVDFAVAAGLEEVVNDPLLWRHGVRAGLALAPAPYVEVAVAVAYYPTFDYDLDAPDIRDPDRWDRMAHEDVLL